MARAYSDDLRRKLLEAHSRGDGSLRELAERFGVSHPYALKISAQRRRSGQMERKPQRRGTRSRMTADIQQHLRRWLKSQTDLTLVQLQERVWEAEREHFSLQHLWRTLKKMGLRLKKSHSTPRNRTAKTIISAVRHGAKC